MTVEEFDLMIENLIDEVKDNFKSCVNCGSEDIKIYYDYRWRIEDWLDNPTYECKHCEVDNRPPY